MQKKISVASRDSRLSRAQVEEVAKALPHLQFETTFLKTSGDLDRTTSLYALDKTDFFTKEIDEMQLRKECRLTIHSAKDLPDPLPKGLVIAAITQGVDSSDALVFNALLGPGARIGTSSKRREESVKELLPSPTFVDIRGTIDERLAILDADELDGVVIAEAALIRLGIERKRVKLPGPGAPLQGQLALVSLSDDDELLELCALLDTR